MSKHFDLDAINSRVALWLRDNTIEGTKPEMIWTDIETTGLDHETNEILEVGFIITDRLGNVVPGGVGQWVADMTGTTFSNVDSFVLDMHESNGLLDAVRQDSAVRRASLEQEAIELYKEHFGDKKVPLSGSSVHFDRRFIAANYEELIKVFHYRNIDISTLKELVALTNPDLTEHARNELDPMKVHRVIPDLIDTIEEYRFYLAEFLWTSENANAFETSLSAGGGA